VVEFVIGLASWVLQDGNYSNFKTGQARRFALEMGYIEDLKATDTDSSLALVAAGDGKYDAVGEVVHEGTVVDFGLISAYTQFQMEHLKRPHVGDRVAGQISLNVDPFFYFEEMVQQVGMVPVIYTWTINKIELDVTPMEAIDPTDPRFPHRHVGPGQTKVYVRTNGARQWRTIDKTRMWKDEAETDDGFPMIAGGYQLTCTLLPEPPTLGGAE
jgi:hypothetical protein